MRRVILSIITLFSAILPYCAHATWFLDEAKCAPPVEPYCDSRIATFEDPEAYAICMAEVAEFRKQSLAYASCLEMKAAETDRRREEILEKWGCRAEKYGYNSGETECGTPD